MGRKGGTRAVYAKVLSLEHASPVHAIHACAAQLALKESMPGDPVLSEHAACCHRMWAIAPETLQGATRNQLYFSYLMCLLSYRQHLLRSASVTSSGGESDITPAMKELMEHPMLGPDLMSSTSGSKPGGNTNGTSGGTSSGGAAAVPADPAVLIALESLIAAMASETSQPCPIPFMPQHYRQQYSSTFASFKHDVNISFLQSDVFRLLKVGAHPLQAGMLPVP
jgi:hypothetical protein